jgi:phage terminase large subunit-like protein
MIDTVFLSDGPMRRDLYFKHMDFLAAGAHHRERVVFGGNRTGKSFLGAIETTFHLTGEYPDWWRGKRYSRPIVAVACGKDGKIVRDSVQRILLGNRDKFGTGFIPGENLDRDRCTMSRAASGLFDEIMVRHITGEWSILRFKSYDMGREAFEATELDWVWEDEEAPIDIHKENLMRTMTTHGAVVNTFTPLKGETPLVADLVRRAGDGSVYQTKIWWDDCPHITKAMIDDMVKRYAHHEIRARRYGEPQLGSGAIYTIEETEFMVRPQPIPDYWPRAYGLDFGWAHPTAALWGALDRETDTVYLYSEHRRSRAEPAIHAAAIRARGDWLTGISETAGTNLTDGKKIFDLYRKDHHLKLKKATKGAGSVEAGILMIQERLAQGRLKVFDNMSMWFEEYRAYHRKENGKIHKQKDDLLDATRYLIMGISRYAKTHAELNTGSVDNVVELQFGRGRT